MSEQAGQAVSKAGEIAKDAGETVQDKFRDLANSAKEKALDLVAADDGAGLSQHNFSVASSARDNVLLGIASAAVAAAVAISCQKSITKQ